MTKKILLFPIILLMFLILLTSCQPSQDQREKPLVMTTLFPHYDMVRVIASDLVDVEMILPAGSDAHHFEPKPRQVTEMKNADLIIFTGLNLEPWMSSIIRTKDLVVLDLSKHIELIEIEDYEHETEHEDHSWLESVWEGFLNLFKSESEDHDFDPHFWLDPVLAITMAHNITDALIDLLPNEAHILKENRDLLIGELETLDQDYLDLMETAENNHIMHGGHNAFSYFASRYGILYHTPFEGFSSDAEPKAQALAEMIELMNTLNIKYLYAEMEIAPNVAQMISQQTGAIILYVYNASNISASNLSLGLSYMDMMRHNYNQFKLGIENE